MRHHSQNTKDPVQRNWWSVGEKIQKFWLGECATTAQFYVSRHPRYWSQCRVCHYYQWGFSRIYWISVHIIDRVLLSDSPVGGKKWRWWWGKKRSLGAFGRYHLWASLNPNSKRHHGALSERRPWPLCDQHWNLCRDGKLQRSQSGALNISNEYKQSPGSRWRQNSFWEEDTEERPTFLRCLDVESVGIALNILKSILKMGGPETSKNDMYQGTLKCGCDHRENLISTQIVALPNEISISSLLGHCLVSSGKLYTPFFGNNVRFFHSAVSRILLNDSRTFLFLWKNRMAFAWISLLSKKSCKGNFFIQFKTLLVTGNEKAEILFSPLRHNFLMFCYVLYTDD